MTGTYVAQDWGAGPEEKPEVFRRRNREDPVVVQNAVYPRTQRMPPGHGVSCLLGVLYASRAPPCKQVAAEASALPAGETLAEREEAEAVTEGAPDGLGRRIRNETQAPLQSHASGSSG